MSEDFEFLSHLLVLLGEGVDPAVDGCELEHLVDSHLGAVLLDLGDGKGRRIIRRDEGVGPYALLLRRMLFPPGHGHRNGIRILHLLLSFIPISAHPPSLRRIDRAFPRAFPYFPVIRLFILHHRFILELSLPLPTPSPAANPTPTSLNILIPPRRLRPDLPPPPLRLLL